MKHSIWVLILIAILLAGSMGNIWAYNYSKDPIIIPTVIIRNRTVEVPTYRNCPVSCIENETGIFCKLPDESELTIVKVWKTELEKNK